MIHDQEIKKVEAICEFVSSECENTEDDIAYLETLFELESIEEDIVTYLHYQKMNSVSCTVDFLELMKEHTSGESLKDVVTFNKSRIIIMIKQFISDLIQIIMEFFQIGFIQKKIMMKIFKQIKAYTKSLVSTFSERTRNKGAYDFSDKPIEIRNPNMSLMKPIAAMALIAVVVKANTSAIIAKVQKRYSNMGKNSPIGSKLREPFLSSDPKRVRDMEKVFEALVSLAGVSAKSSLTSALLTDEGLTRLSEEVAKDNNGQLQEAFLDDSEESISKFVSKVNNGAEVTTIPERLAALLNSNVAEEDMGLFYGKLASALNVTDYTDSSKEYTANYSQIGILAGNSMIDKGSSFFDLFNEGTLDALKDQAREAQERLDDIISSLNDIETIELGTMSDFGIYLMQLKCCESIAEHFKTVDYKKSMDVVKKELDKAQKTIYGTNVELLDYLENNIHITKYITTISYQYNTSKTILNRFIRATVSIIDNGITDIKKVEASIV